MCYNKDMDRSREQIAEGIIKYAGKNSLHIHPGQDPYAWAELVLEKGGCPCVTGRNSCPCAFVKEDIKELGRCRCGLFTDDSYLDTYNSLQIQAKNKKKNASADHVLNNVPELIGQSRETFMKKIAINGFSIEDNGTRITLRPRGLESQAEITIEDNPGNGYRVVAATGRFASFNRGYKRKYLEDNVNRWVLEALQQAP